MTKIKDISIIILIVFFIAILFLTSCSSKPPASKTNTGSGYSSTMYANVTPKVSTSLELRNCEDIHIGQFCTEASNNVRKRCSNEWQEIIENNWCKPFQKDGLDLKSSEELRIVKQSISQRENYLDECKELGFTKGTEGMGNCVLKLMELEKPSQVVISNPSSGTTNSTDAEMLKIEKERLAMEKYKARQDAANKLMDMGKCFQIFGDFSPWC